MLGTSDTLSMRLSSHQLSDLLYCIEDCQILQSFSFTKMKVSETQQNTITPNQTKFQILFRKKRPPTGFFYKYFGYPLYIYLQTPIGYRSSQCYWNWKSAYGAKVSQKSMYAVGTVIKLSSFKRTVSFFQKHES